MRRTALPLLAVLLVACSQSGTPSYASTTTEASNAAPVPPGGVRGRVLESISASSYSYLRLATDSGERWVAVPHTEIAVGTEVTLVNAHEMRDFESRTLGRRFDRILFGNLAGDGTAIADGATGAPSAPVSLDGAVNRTIAALYAERDALANRPVTVRGTVVKYTPGVLDRNWIHLRDGTGTQAARDNDVTITSTESVTIGDVVTMTGVLRVGKDFGAGYSYEVIVEEARVER